MALAAFLFWIAFPDKAALVLSQVASLVAFSGRLVRRRVIRGRVEGHINGCRHRLNAQAPGVAPHDIKLRWARAEDVESYLEQGNVIVKLSYHENQQRNLVYAALLFCRKGILPDSRQYLRRVYQRALDLLMVDMMLSEARLADGLSYFRHDVAAGELERDANLRTAYDLLADLHVVGYFTRLYLPELVDYARKAGNQPAKGYHRDETDRFAGFLQAIAQLPTLRTVPALDFHDNHIRASVVIVGKPELLQARGHDPYIWRLRWCTQQGAETAYLIGAGSSSWEVPDIARRAQREGLGQVVDLKRFRAPSPSGHSVWVGFARLALSGPRRAEEPPSAPSSTG